MRTEPLLPGVRVAAGPDGDAEELAEVTRQVRRELLTVGRSQVLSSILAAVRSWPAGVAAAQRPARPRRKRAGADRGVEQGAGAADRRMAAAARNPAVT